MTGTASVTEALATGRKAAFRIDDYLQHRYPLAGKEAEESPLGDLLPETVETIRKTERLESSILPTEARVKSFEAVELVYDWEAATEEARRCLHCGMGAEILFQDKCHIPLHIKNSLRNQLKPRLQLKGFSCLLSPNPGLSLH